MSKFAWYNFYMNKHGQVHIGPGFRTEKAAKQDISSDANRYLCTYKIAWENE